MSRFVISQGRKRLGILCVAFVVAASLLVWPQIEPLGFAGTGLVGLAMMGIFGGGMVAIIVGLLGSKSRTWQVGLVLVASVVVSFPLSAVIALRQRCVSYERGDEIVVALEAYHGRITVRPVGPDCRPVFRSD